MSFYTSMDSAPRTEEKKTFLPSCEEQVLQKQILTYWGRKKILINFSETSMTKVDWCFHF